MAEKKKKKLTKDQISYDESHGDLKALEAAGIKIPRAVQLADAHGVQHEAIGKGKSKIGKLGSKDPSPGFSEAEKGQNAGIPVSSDPTSPQQYEANVLTMAGLPNTKSNEALLGTQISLEGMPGSEDNPLATTEKAPGSSAVPGNPDNVQEYPSLEEGAWAEAQTLDSPVEKSLYQALLGGTDSPQQYAQALANSDYEGSNREANEQYAQKFLGDTPAEGFATGGTGTGTVSTDPTLGDSALSQAMGTNSFANVSSSTIPSLGTTSSNSSLQSALAGLTSSPEESTLSANTSDAPGSPDQSNSQTQQTSVTPQSTYQQQLEALLGTKLQAGSVK